MSGLDNDSLLVQDVINTISLLNVITYTKAELSLSNKKAINWKVTKQTAYECQLLLIYLSN